MPLGKSSVAPTIPPVSASTNTTNNSISTNAPPKIGKQFPMKSLEEGNSKKSQKDAAELDRLAERILKNMEDVVNQSDNFKGICVGCNEPINGKNVSFKLDDGTERRFHPEHLKCGCDRRLSPKEMIYITSTGIIMCKKEYESDLLGKCFGCGNTFSTDEIDKIRVVPMKKMDRRFHSQCFQCKNCSTPFGDQYYEYMGEPICTPCYEKMSLPDCVRCGLKIGGVQGGKMVTLQTRTYHDTCFVCKTCGAGFENFHAHQHHNEIYCRSCMEKLLVPSRAKVTMSTNSLNQNTSSDGLNESFGSIELRKVTASSSIGERDGEGEGEGEGLNSFDNMKKSNGLSRLQALLKSTPNLTSSGGEAKAAGIHISLPNVEKDSEGGSNPDIFNESSTGLHQMFSNSSSDNVGGLSKRAVSAGDLNKSGQFGARKSGLGGGLRK